MVEGRRERAARSTGWRFVAGSKLKIKATTAQEICAGFPLSEQGQPHLKPEIAPLPFLEALIANGAYADAVQFLSRALPKREAVWWCCVCVRDIGIDPKQPKLAAGLEAAEGWVYRPTEDNRRKAEKAANAVEGAHPARWAAMAAFWSGGSLGPPGAPETKPGEDFTAKAVAGAVMMAAALDPMETDARNKRFLDYGRDIANGGTGRPAAKA
jgi:hypothetical protein